MVDAVDFPVRAALIGTGATVVMDIWGLVRKRLLGIPSLDYALVGRWLGHFASGACMTTASPLRRGSRANGRSDGPRII
ncbi:hypothetical protein ACVW1C_004538 [Bradyrhizobium sp. USDA 4011]